MMAGSSTRSKQRPDTLMQDRNRQLDETLLQRTAGPYMWVKPGLPLLAARPVLPGADMSAQGVLSLGVRAGRQAHGEDRAVATVRLPALNPRLAFRKNVPTVGD